MRERQDLERESKIRQVGCWWRKELKPARGHLAVRLVVISASGAPLGTPLFAFVASVGSHRLWGPLQSKKKMILAGDNVKSDIVVDLSGRVPTGWWLEISMETKGLIFPCSPKKFEIRRSGVDNKLWTRTAACSSW